jgi:hypothetical protein
MSLLNTKICENPNCFASFVPEQKGQMYCNTCSEKFEKMGLKPILDLITEHEATTTKKMEVK